MMANSPQGPESVAHARPRPASSTSAATEPDLPPFPAVATALLQLTVKDDVGLAEVSDVIATDAVVSAELLRVANTAAYAVRGDVSSILHAAAMLGLKRVAGIAAAVALRGYLGAMLRTPVVRRWWRHSLATALTAEETARTIGGDPHTAYTGGLLHDVGRLALIVKYRSEYTSILATSHLEPGELLRLERTQFGTDHFEAGRVVLAAMGLPQELVDVAGHHREVDAEDDHTLFTTVKVACAWATSMGFAVPEQVPEAARDEDDPDAEDAPSVFAPFPSDDQRRLEPNQGRVENIVTALVAAYDHSMP